MTSEAITLSEVELDELSGALVSAATTGSLAGRAAAALVRAEAEARELREQAIAAGRDEGFAAGLAAAEVELAELRSALASAVGEVHGARDALAEAVELRCAEVAVVLAEKVIGAALAIAPELVLSTVAGALRRVLARDSLVIEVAPDDFALVRDHVAEMTEHLGGFHRVEVVAERRVGRGGCVVRTVDGEIDATIASQLERAHELLVAALQRPRAGDDEHAAPGGPAVAE